MKNNLKVKNKAHELIIKSPYATEHYMGKLCALMIANEMLKLYKNFDINIIKKKYQYKLMKEYKFWQEVEKELRKDDPYKK